MKLSDSVSKLPLVGPSYVKKLEKLDIRTIDDLLHHVPSRYNDYRIITKIKNVKLGETITIQGKVEYIKNIYTKNRKNFQEALVTDNTGSIQVIWFNQYYLAKNIKINQKYSFSGKAGEFNRVTSLMSPDYEYIESGKDSLHTARLVPIYPETAGVSSKWLRSKVNVVIQNIDDKELIDFLPKTLLTRYNFDNFEKAIKNIHFPKELSETLKARERLSFDELLLHQMRSLYRKSKWSENKESNKIDIGNNLLKNFVEILPYKLTKSQLRSIKEIYADLAKEVPMNRLLEGDVGSGKTVVAAAAAYASFVNGYQTVVMAPTQILAKQHFDTLNSIFGTLKLRISLVTSAGVIKDLGKSDILVGTHALIHKKVSFDSVGLVIIDEQHRFGVEQRAHLVKKSSNGKIVPNILTMTATPIPRTVALTVYGDLDLSTLDELPKGRQPITTWIVPKKKREPSYDWIKNQIKKDSVQVFFICPLIEESQVDSMKQVKAATKEYEELKTYFKDFKVGLLHGKQKSKEKDKILEKFRKGKIDILVSTPVVEVGIDVPNATIMVIEAGDRYGLAQLHQLRGRIGRGSKKSYCLIFSENYTNKVKTRLKALQRSLNGFELAELDLKLRGPGEVFGTRQHGFPELKVASWNDSRLIKLSKNVAEDAISKPEKYPKLLKMLFSENTIQN